jgi:hypothetical protein
VIGLDPGRTNLAALSYYWIKEDGTIEKKHWSLTRNTFYTESGIKQRSKAKALRFAELHTQWTELGSLRATQENEIVHYIDNYNKIKSRWWELALDKKESVDRLLTYGGKRRVLDKFFIKVKTDVNDACKKAKIPVPNIVIAYGSAHVSMKSTGFGELSTPVSATYQSCRRAFSSRDGSLKTVTEDEYGTTKYDFETATETKKVYKTMKLNNTTNKIEDTFHHCHNKQRSPIVKPEDLQVVKEYYERIKQKKKTRKKPPDPNEQEIVYHYPEIRGLRFCPESRNYVDRDRKSSGCIGRLAVLRMTTQSRPAIFSRQQAQ